jgi:exodeoxyribonuclease VII large subunit
MSATAQTYDFVPAGARVFTVTSLTAEVKECLERDFGDVWVEGEISDFKIHTSGHAYFSLKEGNSVIRAVIWRAQFSKLAAGLEPKTGLEVIANGHLTVYAQRGDYQIQIRRMYAKGLGAAELALRELKEKLSRLGYFDHRRKRPLPRFPRCICLISSATGAAVRDMIEILGRRWPSARVFVRPSRVQGEGAASEISAAIQQVNRWKVENRCATDVIILGRGGGSSDDLSVFNEETVAEAVFRSSIPIVSAVGHEIDITIADLVADVRAATPSHAAELVTPDQTEWRQHLRVFGDRMVMAHGQRMLALTRRLDELSRRRVLAEPLERIREHERSVDGWSERLARAVQVGLNESRLELEVAAKRLESLSPLAVLARGYSLTTASKTGALVRSVEQVQVGELVKTRLHHGTMISRVESRESADPNAHSNGEGKTE